MKQGIQLLFDDPIKSNGCYFLSLVEAVQSEASQLYIEQLYKNCLQNKIINNLCIVLNAIDLLQLVTGDHWIKLSDRGFAIPNESDIIICVNAYNDLYHYNVLKNNGSIWDPLPENLVEQYKRISYHCFKKLVCQRHSEEYHTA